ncbi:hypothetical protein MSG28_013323 [Choristoneura fumiferana]|uniref:Uncharacterized protein n=1 Tax=Choristoneura fumiferana TaxID=7141 RepID=A0ACC0KTU8_CHOFU|nr:hypothetical protein MSG28_013323 [Choristoneura fumiferana]
MPSSVAAGEWSRRGSCVSGDEMSLRRARGGGLGGHEGVRETGSSSGSACGGWKAPCGGDMVRGRIICEVRARRSESEWSARGPSRRFYAPYTDCGKTPVIKAGLYLTLSTATFKILATLALLYLTLSTATFKILATLALLSLPKHARQRTLLAPLYKARRPSCFTHSLLAFRARTSRS